MQRLVQMFAVAAVAAVAWMAMAGTAVAAGDSDHSGLLIEAGNGKIKIREQGKEVSFDVAPNVKIMFEGRESTLGALPAEHPVTLHVVTTKEKAVVGTGETTTTLVTSIDLPAPWHRTGGGVMSLIVVVVAISFGVGRSLARSLRMPNHGWRIGLMVFCVLAGTVVTWLGWPPTLGLDLSGGVRLVYQIDRTRNQAGAFTDDKNKGQKADNAKQDDGGKRSAQSFTMGDMVAAISRRVNPGGQKEYVVRTYGQDEIEVVVPKADPIEIERIKKIISSSGLLEFRILANPRDQRHARAITLGEALLLDKTKLNKTQVMSGDEVVARWVKLDMTKFRSAEERKEMITRLRDGELEVLVREDPLKLQVNGGDLDYARTGIDGGTGGWAVNFGFNDVGAAKFSDLTGKNLPDASVGLKNRLGIVLDNTLLSAPNLNSRIGANGQITGHFTEAEVKTLVEILNAGKLPAALTQQPVAEENIDALLGADTIRTATFAMWLACAAVPAFMIFYYRFSGIVATLTTALHMLLIVAVMILIKAQFTLTGLAALALTVGMAVDANVLIYERMREELARGAALKMAIRNGFDRALHTIIDTNVTTLIAATVLYVIGTDQVKGFAVTLWLGVVLNVFTATFGTRVLFDVAEKMHLLKKLKMLRIIGVPSIDFMGKQRIWIGISIVTTVIGLFSFFSLGRKIWDIDFTGGSQVDVHFAKDSTPTEPATVQTALEQTLKQDNKTLDDLTVSKIFLKGPPEVTLYRIVTSDQDVEKVKTEIAKAFEGKLKTLNVEMGKVAAITPEPAQPEKKPVSPLPFPPLPDAKEPPATDKPDAEKPAADKPAESTDKAEKTPSEKPAEGGKSTDKKSSDKKSSAVGPRFQSDVQLASTSPNGVMLALADDPNTPPTDKTKAGDAPKADDKAKPEDQPKADDKTPVDDKAKGDDKAKTDETPKPAPQPKPDDEPKKNAITASEIPEGSTVKMTLSEPTSYAVVDKFFLDAEKKLKDTFPNLHHELSNPKFEGNPRAAFAEWDVRLSVPPEKAQPILDEFTKIVQSPDFTNADHLGPQVADKTERQTMYALVASWALIILYVWIRFQRVAYGLAAVIALIHDVIVAVGALALCHYLYAILPPAVSEFLLIEPFKVNLTIIAAMLTIIGYSVNDTIVVFDRIREVKGKAPDVTDQIVNDSINQTLSRTLLTSFTVFLVVLILYIFGGIGVRAFAFTMMIGVLTGTYSSIYIASPILVWMERLGKSHREKAKLANTSPATAA